MAAQPVEFEEFAACLRALKERAGLSYEALARKTGISGSSLHRYCSGSYVPQDYGSAHRFATVCGASPEELRRLHRLWALADASRETARDLDPERERELVSEPGSEPGSPPALTAPTPAPRPPWRRRRLPVLGVIALVLALGASAWGVVTASGTGSAFGGATVGDGRLLFSPACAGPVSMGRRGTCVREVQRLLSRAGAAVDVDGVFGPQTLRRVTAFQVLSRIGSDGVVDEETKKALYAPAVRMDTWSREKVGQRVREVFGEAADRAVAVAVCQSSLDPLHIVSNADSTRNWGVFQISDATLRKSGGTSRDAIDPEWNIQAAHRLWSRTKDFRAWPYCGGEATPEAVEPGSAKASEGPSVPPTRSASSAACPAPGQRFKLAADNRVYLVGPGSSLYYIPDETVYFNLWDSWDGLVTLSGEVFADCEWPKAYSLTGAFLARARGSAPMYIWDVWYGFRRIPDGTAFDRYGFARAKIQTRTSLSPAGSDPGWR